MHRTHSTPRTLAPALLLLLAVAAAGIVAGCGTDAVPGASVALTLSATNAAMTSGPAGAGRMAVTVTDQGGNTIELTDFQLSMRDIKFQRDDMGLEENEIEFRGPYVVDLLEAALPVADFLGSAVVPEGVYEGIRLVMHSSPDTPAPLTERSIYLAGTVTPAGGGPAAFTFWHTANENFDIAGPNGFTMAEGALNDIVVDFKLVSIVEAVDFTDVTDGAVIAPGGPHDALADALKNAIKAAADFGRDSNDDGVLDESEDVN